MLKVFLAIGIVAAFAAAPADARCSAKVVRPVHPQGQPDVTLHRGEPFGPPTQIVVEKDGTAWICAHGDYCYDPSGIVMSGCVIRNDPEAFKIPGDDTIVLGLYDAPRR
jgi:hypothetical protein